MTLVRGIAGTALIRCNRLPLQTLGHQPGTSSPGIYNKLKNYNNGKNDMDYEVGVGCRVGLLTIQERISRSDPRNTLGDGRPYWLCACECGNTKLISHSDLRRGHSTSCGCLRVARAYTLSRTHGMRHTITYNSWRAMKARCADQNDRFYKDYGARGITYDPAWESFEAFLGDVGIRPSPAHTLDRKENNQGYSKDNCCWVLPEQQANNRRNNVFVYGRGKLQTVAQWARELKCNYEKLRYRISRGWTFEEATCDI